MSGLEVILLRSTDVGAPTLNGTAGSLIALLDACLKDGYNANTIQSITRVGAVATVTYATAHNYAADGLTKVAISGADQSEYNGTQQITNVSTTAFDFTVAGTPASGTGTMVSKVAPLGWEKPLTGTNTGVYRSLEVTATRLYLRVNDNNTDGNGFKGAWVRGYEAMTDVNTGTGLFPTVTQGASGIWVVKSNELNANAKEWVLVGDGLEFHFFPRHVPNSPTPVYQQFHFGDPAAEMASDPFGCLIYGNTANSVTWAYENQESHIINTAAGQLSAQIGHYFARSYTQTGESVRAGKQGNYTLGNSVIGGLGMTYPAPHNNGLYIAPLFIHDTLVLRAQLKGIYQPLHMRPLSFNSVLAAADSPIGRRLYVLRTAYTHSNNDGQTHIDIDGPWR